MTTDPYIAVASVIGSILGLRQCVTLSHRARESKTERAA